MKIGKSTHATEYDVLGRVKKETYPSGYYTGNKYDTNGYLYEITDNANRSIWKAVEGNAMGQLTKISKNNRVTDYAYTPAGQLERIYASGIIDMNYQYNAKGNMSGRTDALSSQYEDFDYDNHNRLTNYDIYRNSALVKESSIDYNPTTGNIESKSDLGDHTFNYGEENGKPHALTSITGVPSAIATADLSVTYTDFKKMATLTEGSKSYSLTYGVDEQRRKSVYSENSIARLTRYYLGSYEEEVDPSGNIRKLHFIGAGDGLAAIYIQNHGCDSLLYAYTDHLGSPIALTTENHAVVERYAFDPWGNRRNPMDWRLFDDRISWIINRGFTGHEHLDAFAIINMNGRVYDPLTAQFFSPDPYIQAPSHWLNYNRYSYALNNPLAYTDPSGEFVFSILAAIFCQPLLPIAIGTDIGMLQGGMRGDMTPGMSFWDGAWRGGITGAMGGAFSMVGGGPFLTNLSWGISGGTITGGLNAALWNDNIGKGMLVGGITSAAMTSLTSPEFNNLVNGKGFNNNNKVLDNFRAGKYTIPKESTWQQEALNYFGFEGQYDPDIKSVGQFDTKTEVISYGKTAFSKNYDYLKAVYGEEAFHKLDYLVYEDKVPKNVYDPYMYEEWRAQFHMYKNQGLYRKSGFNWVERLNSYGVQSGLYDSYTSLFESKWWHFMYKIPRRW